MPDLAARTQRDPYFSRAVGKAFEALRWIGDEPRSLAEITAALELTKASAFRLLHTLESLGEITRDGDGGYVRGAVPKWQLEALQELASGFRETVSLALLRRNHVEVVAVFDSPHLMRMGNTVGRILPPHASSLGKAVVAFQEPDAQGRLLRAYGTPVITPHTVSDVRELKQEYARIRKQGYAEDREESAVGGVCFAVPVLLDGLAVGAVSISMPKERALPARRIVTPLKNTAARLSARATSDLKPR